MMIAIKTRYEEVKDLGQRVCEQLLGEMDKLGLNREMINPRLERASFELSRDPSTGEHSLVGVWKDKNGLKQGTILFHADGSFFAEYDVVCEHPQKPQWFVEAVTAWGNKGLIKSESRLLPIAS
jgi:hypothetical protein